MTKLYEVPRNSRIRFTDEGETTELNFSHIDGMYSYNTDDKGNVWHLAAWTEVEVVDEDLYDAAVRADNGGQTMMNSSNWTGRPHRTMDAAFQTIGYATAITGYGRPDKHNKHVALGLIVLLTVAGILTAVLHWY